AEVVAGEGQQGLGHGRYVGAHQRAGAVAPRRPAPRDAEALDVDLSQAVEQARRRDVAVDDAAGVGVLEALQGVEDEPVVHGALAACQQRGAAGEGGHEVAARAAAVVEDVGRQHLERVLRDGGTGRDRGGAGEVVDQYVQAGDRVYATGG